MNFNTIKIYYILNIMINEDSTKALFAEPNAYIQNYRVEKNEKKREKIVFQEPYETLPNYYMNNGFKKGDCDCETKPKPNPKPNNKPNSPFPFSFDFKNLMPLLGGFLKNGNLSNIVSMLTGKGEKSNGNFNLSQLLSGLGGDGLSNIFNLFKGSNNSKAKNKVDLKQTDFQINEYTRVE